MSSRTGQGIQDLYKTIIQTTLDQPYIGEMIPESWLKLSESIIGRRMRENVLEWDKVESEVKQ